MRDVLRYLGALLGGLAAGAVLTLGVLVVRAQVQSRFLHSMGGGIGWAVVPGVLLALVPLWLARARDGRLAGAGAGALGGLLAGGLAGAVAGALLSSDPVLPWAAGAVGAAAGIVIGGAVGAVLGRRHLPPDRPSPVRQAAVVVLALILAAGTAVALAGRRDREPLPAADVAPEPRPAEVESVVFFLGDPGEATSDRSPILPRLGADVEWWAGSLERDSAVAVVILGDVVYPVGLRDPDSGSYARDSTVVAGQVGLVAGPEAMERGARAIFLAGNHDWGREENVTGARRLRNLERFLERRRREGPAVSLLPSAGTGGPAVVDVGAGLRLLILDTAWWLLDAEPDGKRAVVDSVERVIRDAGGRTVGFAAHHPFVSAGPHGGWARPGAGWIRALLSRSGVLLQDIHSAPYRDLRSRLVRVFEATAPPRFFAGGHEHSLQVIRSPRSLDPEWSVVVGSGSKLTGMELSDTRAFGRSVPGYGRLFVLRDGTLRLDLVAAPARYLRCPASDPERSRCMEEGVGAYRTVWSGVL